jgi:UDP-N-acetylglucosamine 2-epimerase (hydrolysing)
MFSDSLPTLEVAKKHYGVDFEEFAIVMFHPVTTESNEMQQHALNFVNSLLADTHNYIVIYPNNDRGSASIIKEYERLKNNARFRVFPSLRFEYFLTLLKSTQFIIGNSSAGIREAPYYGVPIINIGTRQQNRAVHADIVNVDYTLESINSALKDIDAHQVVKIDPDFGEGNSGQLFLESIEKETFWTINHQKQFREIL